MRKVLALTMMAMIAFATLANAADQPQQQKAQKIRTLIVTGNDVDVHVWRETTPALRKILEDSGKFAVKVSEDPNILESADALKNYDLIVLNYTQMKDPAISDKAKENFLNYVKGGKGFVSFHLSSGSWQDWEAFHNMVGRWWKFGTSGHGPRSTFKVNVVKDHPITKGVAKTFEADDELYAKLLGEGEIDILVTADSDWSKKTEPLAFTLKYGEGRVYHHAFGHDVKAITEENVAKLFAQGAEWAATGDVK